MDLTINFEQQNEEMQFAGSTIIPLTYGISRGTETIMSKNRKKIQYCHQTTRNKFLGDFHLNRKCMLNTREASPSDF